MDAGSVSGIGRTNLHVIPGARWRPALGDSNVKSLSAGRAKRTGAQLLPLLLVTGLALSALAEDRGLALETTNLARGSTRTALIIGNANYSTSPLRNPANDAQLIGETLAQLGFDVTVKTDLRQADMKLAIRDFGRRLRSDNGVGLFYFAGHALQVNGENYLVPVDALLERESDVDIETVRVNEVLAKMDGNPMNIVILDACRNNPFARSFRSQSGGLAFMDAPSGTLVAYATAPGSVAADGDGENGVYTKHLVKAIKTDGLRIEDIFKRTRVGVQNETNNDQRPWESSSLTGDFYFGGASVAAVPTEYAPVRAPERRFEHVRAGVVFDRETGLEWFCPSGRVSYTRKQAGENAPASEWSLPTNLQAEQLDRRLTDELDCLRPDGVSRYWLMDTVWWKGKGETFRLHRDGSTQIEKVAVSERHQAVYFRQRR